MSGFNLNWLILCGVFLYNNLKALDLKVLNSVYSSFQSNFQTCVFGFTNRLCDIRANDPLHFMMQLLRHYLFSLVCVAEVGWCGGVTDILIECSAHTSYNPLRLTPDNTQ